MSFLSNRLLLTIIAGFSLFGTIVGFVVLFKEREALSVARGLRSQLNDLESERVLPMRGVQERQAEQLRLLTERVSSGGSLDPHSSAGAPAKLEERLANLEESGSRAVRESVTALELGLRSLYTQTQTLSSEVERLRAENARLKKLVDSALPERKSQVEQRKDDPAVPEQPEKKDR